MLNIGASLNKSVICHCLIGADLNIHVEFKHLFVPKRTVSASFEKELSADRLLLLGGPSAFQDVRTSEHLPHYFENCILHILSITF